MTNTSTISEKYTVVNNCQGTNAAIGITVKRCSQWSVSGHALFTNEVGGLVWAHLAELKELKN
jgi:hypothetical protein